MPAAGAAGAAGAADFVDLTGTDEEEEVEVVEGEGGAADATFACVAGDSLFNLQRRDLLHSTLHAYVKSAAAV